MSSDNLPSHRDQAEPGGGMADSDDRSSRPDDAAQVEAAQVEAAVAWPDRDIFSLLFNSNPFYFISALLVLVGVRLGYGEVPVGSLNCWGMLGVLAGYTMLMAAAGVLVIRVGKVWDDARSIIVTLVLLFVAMSVSFDELLIIAPAEALELTLAGWLFALAISETVLLLASIRFPVCYRVPYHLAIALLFWFPYFSSPELTEFTEDQTQWRLLAFPWMTAAIALTLLPAIWQGDRSVAGNTTPWKWPVFPWSLFGFLGVVCVLRTYVLTFSFGPSDSFETSFGAIHLFPMAIATSILLLEAGHKHRRVAPTVLAMMLPVVATAGLYLDGWGRPSALIAIEQFRIHICEPKTAAFAIAGLFYGLALIRRVPGADFGLIAAVFGLMQNLQIGLPIGESAVPAVAFIVGGAGYFAVGAYTRSATRMVIGTGVFAAMWITSPLVSPLSELRVAMAFHTALLGLMLTGPLRGGQVGRWIVNGVLVLFVAASAAAFFGYEAGVMTPHWTLSYIGSMACVSTLYGRLLSDRRFHYAARVIACLFIVRVSIIGVKLLVDQIGLRATASIAAGIASFIVAGVISTVKSRQTQPSVTDDEAGYSVAAAD